MTDPFTRRLQAFVSYMKSVHLQKDKSIFDLTQLPIEAFAASLGLPGAPQIKFIGQAHQRKNAARGKLQQQQDKEGKEAEVAGRGTNMAGEKEVESRLEGVELGDSESDESEVDSDSDVELEDVKAVVQGEDHSDEDEDDDDDSLVQAKDDIPAAAKKASRALVLRLSDDKLTLNNSPLTGQTSGQD